MKVYDTDNISELVPDILAKDASTSAFSAADTSIIVN